MQSVPRQIKVARLVGDIEVRQGESNPIQLVGTYPAGVASLIEPPQSSMAKRSDHRVMISCSGTPINSFTTISISSRSLCVCSYNSPTCRSRESLRFPSSIWEANRVLDQFLPRFNRRFRVPPQHPEPAFRPLDPELCLEQVLCFKHPRRVARDNTVRFQLHTLQLLPGPERHSYAGAAVEVLEGLDGRLSVRHEGRILASQEAPPSSVLLRNGHGRSAPVPVAPSGANGLGERWTAALQPLDSRAAEEKDQGDNTYSAAAASKPKAASPRKPTFLQKTMRIAVGGGMIAMIITSVLLMVSAPAVDVSGGGALFLTEKPASPKPTNPPSSITTRRPWAFSSPEGIPTSGELVKVAVWGFIQVGAARFPPGSAVLSYGRRRDGF